MKITAFGVLALLAAVGCGGTTEGGGSEMFERPGWEKVAGRALEELRPGGRVQIIQFPGVEEGDSEPYIVTLWPGQTGTDQVTPILGLYASITSGDGQANAVPMEVDFGQGISFVWRGRSFNLTAVNDSNIDMGGAGIIALGPSAFVSRGVYSPQIPRRTKPGFYLGALVSPTNLMPPGGGTDLVSIPPYAQRVTLQYSPSQTAAAAPFQTFISIQDKAGTVIADFDVFSGSSVDLPSDAYQMQLVNPGPSATSIAGVRFIFTLGSL